MRHLYEKFFAHQLGRPSGAFGRLFMERILNRENLRSNQLALQHLLETPLESVLEIGFGGGWLIAEVLKASEGVKVTGLDHSETMVAAARKKFRAHSHRAEFHFGKAERLPFPAESFSHVVSVHTAYFWENPDEVTSEIHRVLHPAGIVVLGIHSKAKLAEQSLTKHGFRLYEPRALVDLLAAKGFQQVALHSYDPEKREDNHCVVARKAPPAKDKS